MSVVLIVLSSVASFFAAACIYVLWLLSRTKGNVGHWQDRAQQAEQKGDLLTRHLSGLSEVLHQHGGGVVNRYYETSALRFVMQKRMPSLFTEDLRVAHWLRTQSEFFHALAVRAAKIDSTDEIRRRVKSLDAGHSAELDAFDDLGRVASSDERSSGGSSEATSSVELRLGASTLLGYLTQVATALLVAGRVAAAGQGDAESLFAGAERFCRAAERLARALPGEDGPLVKVMIEALDLLGDSRNRPGLTNLVAKEALPSLAEIEKVRMVALRSRPVEERTAWA